MRTLVFKLLRDLRVPLIVVCLLLALFQVLWTRITSRITGELVPAFSQEMPLQKIKERIFEGPGKLMQTFMGGETIHIERAMDILSIGYVHPAMLVVFCIWSIGRASGAIAGEIDRGTMELLLAQPIPRYRIVLAHLTVDGIVIAILCLSLWTGSWIGAWLFTPIQPAEADPMPILEPPADSRYRELFEELEAARKRGQKPNLMQVLPQIIKLQQEDKGPADEKEMMRIAVHLLQQRLKETNPIDEAQRRELLRVEPLAFGPSLVSVAAMLFAISGYTMWLSARGRFRWRVMGLAVLITLVQFLVNLLGQLWETMEWLRPFTVFYYYQPQQIILNRNWMVEMGTAWNHGRPLFGVPGALVLFLVGATGYALAFRVFCKRDLPAPL